MSFSHFVTMYWTYWNIISLLNMHYLLFITLFTEKTFLQFFSIWWIKIVKFFFYFIGKIMLAVSTNCHQSQVWLSAEKLVSHLKDSLERQLTSHLMAQADFYFAWKKKIQTWVAIISVLFITTKVIEHVLFNENEKMNKRFTN